MLEDQGCTVTSAPAGDATSVAPYPDIVIFCGESIDAVRTAHRVRGRKNMGCEPLTFAIVDPESHAKFAARPFADDYLTRPVVPEMLVARVGLLARLRDAQEHLSLHGYIEPQTGVWGKHVLLARTAEEIAFARRHRFAVSCSVVRVGNLQKINTDYGYESGDVVLRETARILRHSIRRSDFLSRSAGNEFTVLLRQCDGEQAVETMRRICARINGNKFFDGRRTIKAEILWGTASSDESDTEFSADKLVAAAAERACQETDA